MGKASEQVRVKLKNLLAILWIPTILLLSWEALSRYGYIRPTVLPAPSTILTTLLDLVRTGEIFLHLGVSILRVAEGFLLGASLGLVLGILIGLFKQIERAFSLLIGLLRPIPIMAWVPVMILWMGIDEASKVILIAIGCFWAMLLNVVHGIRNTDKKYLEVAEILGKNRLTTLTRVILPSSLPYIFTGMRIGIDIAWRSVVGAELVAAASGIGFMIMYAREISQTDTMLAGVISIGITGLGIDFLLKKLETRFLKWNISINGN